MLLHAILEHPMSVVYMDCFIAGEFLSAGILCDCFKGISSPSKALDIVEIVTSVFLEKLPEEFRSPPFM